jgi:DNA helicase HerA-like ATPase
MERIAAKVGQMARIFLGGGAGGVAELDLAYANRHGLIAGATGTGKTVSLQVLAEGFAAAGVAVFLADVKGDLAGLAQPGDPGGPRHGALQERAKTIGWDLAYRGFPVTFWDIAGQAGVPIRATLAEMGPLLLARVLGLSEVQEGVLQVAFRWAEEEGLLLLDLADLRAVLARMAEERETVSARHGLVTTASIGAIQRSLLSLEAQGGAALFGEPALDLADLLQPAPGGEGMIHILHAAHLIAAPALYASFLLWLLSELFETLPEIGDPEKPRLVFFFDEAHLLFADAPAALVAKVEQVVRLIRSKGVGIYFVTQSPADIPAPILGQLGNRIQHALRAWTPRDQKALSDAAETYRPNPAFQTAEAIRDLATGEAIVSCLEAKGVPAMVQRVLIRPPMSQIGPIPDPLRQSLIAAAALRAKYAMRLERDSAAERLSARLPESYTSARRIGGGALAPSKTLAKSGEAFATGMARTIGQQAGKALVRGILGGLFGRR